MACESHHKGVDHDCMTPAGRCNEQREQDEMNNSCDRQNCWKRKPHGVAEPLVASPVVPDQEAGCACGSSHGVP